METIKYDKNEYIKSFSDAIPSETVTGMKLKHFLDTLKDPRSYACKFNVPTLSIYDKNGVRLMNVDNPTSSYSSFRILYGIM